MCQPYMESATALSDIRVLQNSITDNLVLKKRANTSVSSNLQSKSSISAQT